MSMADEMIPSVSEGAVCVDSKSLLMKEMSAIFPPSKKRHFESTRVFSANTSGVTRLCTRYMMSAESMP